MPTSLPRGWAMYRPFAFRGSRSDWNTRPVSNARKPTKPSSSINCRCSYRSCSIASVPSRLPFPELRRICGPRRSQQQVTMGRQSRPRGRPRQLLALPSCTRPRSSQAQSPAHPPLWAFTPQSSQQSDSRCPFLPNRARVARTGRWIRQYRNLRPPPLTH